MHDDFYLTCPSITCTHNTPEVTRTLGEVRANILCPKSTPIWLSPYPTGRSQETHMEKRRAWNSRPARWPSPKRGKLRSKQITLWRRRGGGGVTPVKFHVCSIAIASTSPPLVLLQTSPFYKKNAVAIPRLAIALRHHTQVIDSLLKLRYLNINQSGKHSFPVLGFLSMWFFRTDSVRSMLLRGSKMLL